MNRELIDKNEFEYLDPVDVKQILWDLLDHLNLKVYRTTNELYDVKFDFEKKD